MHLYIGGGVKHPADADSLETLTAPAVTPFMLCASPLHKDTLVEGCGDACVSTTQRYIGAGGQGGGKSR